MKTCKDCPFYECRKVTTRTFHKDGRHGETTPKHWCNYRKAEVSKVMRCYVVDNPTRYLKTQSTPEVIFIED